SVNDMGGCQTQREVELRSPVGYMVTATPVEMQGGQYASCDTCSDVTVNAATLGAWGAVQYAWAEVPAEQTPFRLRGASLSISEGGGNMDTGLFNGSDPSVFGTGAQQTGLMTETMYMVATMDELGCMGQVMFTVERPRAEQAAVPAWGLHGNDSTGAALDGDGAPWLGTSDSTDVVMKANGVPQLRLGADGVTSMEGQLRLAQVPNSLAEARLLMLNPDGSIGAYESAPGVSWPPPVSDGSCYGDGLDGPMQGVWDPGINKLTTCPQINVGIGVENPQYKLHVKDNARITGNLISSSMNSTRLNLDSDVNSASTGNRLYIKASAGTDAALIDNPDGNPILRILKDGNIGVGTSSPQARLDVRDAEGNAALRVYNDGKVVAGAPLLGQGDEALLYIGDENHYIRSLFDKGLSLSTAGADDALVIDDWSGKVNIGGRYTGSVPLSGYKLSVNGTIVGKEFYVTADPWNIDPWPDFVFNKGYELRPLDELQRFINEQGHLPEMPTAEEVETQGVGMARMSTLLLQKVEELTLYMLQMDKRMKELEEENSRLKERLTIND
ncbi:MAG: hypothetical protein K9J06_14370, partial [Flavobacteriales bacterium]|nr:hypothetical protein [Flavobacteriales bacterium]